MSCWALLIAAASLALVEALLYTFAPFHFRRGPLDEMGALKEACSYLLENSLEELMFRGFLLVILSRFIGWRIAILVLALPFGLFHLQGSGISVASLKLVASAAIYSFVFSLSYLLTGSMWTAISAHVTSNILFHMLLGIDGKNSGMFVQISSGKIPGTYDLGFCALILGALAISLLLYMSVSSKARRMSAAY